MSRREREESLHRSLLAEAAAALFAQKSYYATTVEEITRSAEFGKGTFYKYFSHKEEVPLYLLHQALQDLNASISMLLQKSEPYPNLLQDLASGLFQYHQNTHSLIFLVHNILQINHSPFYTDWQEKIIDGVQEKSNLLSQFFALGSKQKFLHPYASDLMARVFDNLLKGAASPHLPEEPQEHRLGTIDELVEIFKRGVCLD